MYNQKCMTIYDFIKKKLNCQFLIVWDGNIKTYTFCYNTTLFTDQI